MYTCVQYEYNLMITVEIITTLHTSMLNRGEAFGEVILASAANEVLIHEESCCSSTVKRVRLSLTSSNRRILSVVSASSY